MIKNVFLYFFAAVWLSSLVGCGKEIVGKQERQRNEMTPELVGGTWTSRCEGNSIARISFTDASMTIVHEKYYDAECQDPRRTVTQTGTYKLAHNFKEGILNGIVFVSTDKFEVVQIADFEVDTANNVLTSVQNENETPIKSELSAQARRDVTRENLRIREAKLIPIWKRGESKSLNRLQTEKLNAYGLSEKPFMDFESRAMFKYEFDNGFLQVNAPVIGGRVFTKQ